MKKVLTLVAVAAFAFSVASCSKCQTCDSCPDGVTLDDAEICQADFDNKDDYDAAIAIIEAFGCTCS